MYLDTGTLIGLTIALAGSCAVMVISIMSHRNLTKENYRLKKLLRERSKK